MTAHTFSLADANGDEHAYEVTPHAASEGLAVARRLGALVVEPITAGLGPAIIAGIGTGNDQILDDPEALQAIDAAGLGRALSQQLQLLPDDMLYQVLRYTNRDGKALIGKGMQPTARFNEAYACNYGELFTAAWQVCLFNAFFPGGATLQRLAEVGQQLLAQRQEQPDKQDGDGAPAE